MTLPAPALAVAAMVSVQLGAALSTHLFDALTPAGSAWVRLAVAAAVLLAVARPRPSHFSRPAVLGTVLLGGMTGLMTMAFIEAVARIPLGTAVAIEFLGPLGVAAARAHRRLALLWPALAAVGVAGLTEPWTGRPDLAGIGLAAVAAAGWAGYLVLTQRVGAQVVGLGGVAASLAVAAAAAAPVAAAPALAGLTPALVLQAAGLAVLVPLLPYVLELAALRRMRLSAFGTLMALEPGIATALGLALLGQAPTAVQAAGVALVVAAGIGAQRTAGTGAQRTAATAATASGPAARSAGLLSGRSQEKPEEACAVA